MNETPTDLLSAFVDNEPVDPDALAAALEDPAGRAALVDFVRMRQQVTASREPLPPSLMALRHRPLARSRAFQWSAAAAVLVLVFLAGWIAPGPFPSAEEPDAGVPKPARVESFEPGVDWTFR